MKKILLMFLLAAAPVFAQAGFDPIGKWEATDTDGIEIRITFDAENYVTMQKGDEVIGGRHFTLEGLEAEMTYKFKPGTNHVDFIMKDLESGKEFLLQGIYKFEDNQLVLAMDNSQRPDDFDSENTMTFTRVKL
jgi:uncharacterized protein (TIGR03067 family)